jgi:hypothetical protein
MVHGTSGIVTPLLLSAAAGSASAAGSVYVGGHWDGKKEVPLVAGFNEAVGSVKIVRGQLALLGMVWAVSVGVEGGRAVGL